MEVHPEDLSSPGAGPSRAQVAPKRAKTGCITCRVRKKRCDERKPYCASCERLGIECLGYSSKRPGWLRGDDNKKKVRADLKKQILSQKTGSNRGRDESEDQEESYEGSMAYEDVGNGNGYRNGSIQEGFGVPPIIGHEPGHGNGHGYRTEPISPIIGHEPGHGNGHGYRTEPTPSIDPYPINPQLSRNNSATAYTMSELSTGMMPPTNITQEMWTQPTQASWDMQPLQHIPPDQSLAVAAITESTNEDGTTQDATFEDVWRILFGDNTGFTPTPTPAPPTVPQGYIEPDPRTDLPLLSVVSPSVYGAADNRHVEYLHHYLNVVLPLQYRFGSRQLTDLIGPLAMTRKEVLTSAASLAALHLVAQRTHKPLNLPTSWTAADEAIDDGSGDRDTLIAKSTHRRSIERLRFLSSEDLTSEDTIVSALFAISFHLFSGGTSREWREVMLTSQRCLSAALSASPELSGTSQMYNLDTPWGRYKPLIAVMVWMDILGSVTLNKASRLLPTYRRLLDQRPMMPTPPHLSMANVMGCDNTTMLALAETVQLSEWKEYAESTGCLSVRELLRRAATIETLLQERSWREGLLDANGGVVDDGLSGESPENQSAIRVMREIFYGAARLYLATVINGPYPRVPEVATAVQDVTEALRRLDTIQEGGDGDINRSLVLPITLAGCHCETPSQQAFFRSRFQKLGGDAAAFGNSRQALQLMEEVWRKRAVVDPGTKVCWRAMMKALGWDCGILLI